MMIQRSYKAPKFRNLVVKQKQSLKIERRLIFRQPHIMSQNSSLASILKLWLFHNPFFQKYGALLVMQSKIEDWI